jgi:hypothetical protein
LTHRSRVTPRLQSNLHILHEGHLKRGQFLATWCLSGESRARLSRKANENKTIDSLLIRNESGKLSEQSPMKS